MTTKEDLETLFKGLSTEDFDYEPPKQEKKLSSPTPLLNSLAITIEEAGIFKNQFAMAPHSEIMFVSSKGQGKPSKWNVAWLLRILLSKIYEEAPKIDTGAVTKIVVTMVSHGTALAKTLDKNVHHKELTMRQAVARWEAISTGISNLSEKTWNNESYDSDGRKNESKNHNGIIGLLTVTEGMMVVAVIFLKKVKN